MSGWEILAVFVVLVSGGMIVFGRNPMLIIAGSLFLFFLGHLAQKESDERRNHAFVFERFKAGDALECGMLRSNQTLVDPAKGWKLYGEDSFIKGDQIINEVKWCNVVGKTSPEQLNLWGWITYAGIALVFGILRFALRNTRKEFYHEMDKAVKDDKVADADSKNNKEIQ